MWTGQTPIRHPELGLHRAERLDLPVNGGAIDIPPAGPVRDEVKRPVRRPFRLEDRFVRTAGDQTRVLGHAIVVQVGEPKLGAVPRHVWVVPGEPGQPRALRAEAW